MASRAVVLGLVLLTAACGARWTEEEQTQVLGRRDATSSRATGGRVLAEATTTTIAAAAGPGSPSTGMAAPAPGGAAAPVTASGPSPCHAPSNAPGVTDREITVGTISSVSGPVPGLGASAQAAAKAYVAFLNSNGGVCGRKVVLRTADDGSDNARYRAAALEFSSKVLGVVGGLAAGDGGGTEVVTEAEFPVVSLPTASSFEAAPTVFDMNPPFADLRAVIGKYRYLRDQGVDTVALVYTAVDQARAQIRSQQAQMEAAGMRVVLDHAAPLSTLSWDGAARAVANSKADYLFFLSDAGASASMARAMADSGYELKFGEYLTAYGSTFIELARAAAEGSTSWIRTLPSEDGGRVPEQRRFLDFMKRTAPDAVTDTFASDSWVASKAFFDALTGLPGPISRGVLLAKLRGTATYDAGGFLGPIKLGAKQNGGCYVAMVVRGGQWRRLTPQSGFLC